jgi:hypothetical protein
MCVKPVTGVKEASPSIVEIRLELQAWNYYGCGCCRCLRRSAGKLVVGRDLG